MSNHIQTKWGYELRWADTKLYSAHMLVIQDGQQTSYYYHKNRDKTIFVLQGTVHLYVEGINKMLNAGEGYHISPTTMHRIIAIKGDAAILETGTPLEDDVVIVEA